MTVDQDVVRVAVVIPFYQREAGFLRAAVASVFAQRLSRPAHVEVVVVDDASPASVADEGLPEPPPGFSLRVLHRANGGAGAARNTGLDALDEDVRFVAFLDSDDRWTHDHLTLALDALKPGVDFYFSNNFTDDGLDTFGYSSYMRGLWAGVDAGDDAVVRCATGSEIFDKCLSDVFIHTSQAVFRRAMGMDVRFSTDLRRSGEDLLFFVDLANRVGKVAFTVRRTGFRGRGVSIYRETLVWGSPLGLETTVDELILRQRMQQRFDLSRDQLARLANERRKSCDHLMFLAIRNIVRHPRMVAAALSRITRQAPEIWAFFPRSLFSVPRHRAQLLQFAGQASTLS